MYKSDYYKVRGRLGELRDADSESTHTMGILTSPTGLCTKNLPEHRSRWIADSKSQDPDLKSPYTQSLIQNDTPYVSGPSGMTSLFCGLLLGLDLHETKAARQHYIAAVTAYMISGGFHSLHEVLGPIAYCLPEADLIPSYQVTLSTPDQISKPPNFHAFYDLMSSIDPQFSEVLENGWQKLIDFMSNEYIPTIFPPKQTIESTKKYQPKEESQEEIRTEDYKNLIKDAKTPLQRIVILYALTQRTNPTLEKYTTTPVSTFFGSDVSHIKKTFHTELEKFPKEKQTVIMDVMKEITRAADNKKPYKGQSEPGDFEQPLKELEKLEGKSESDRPIFTR